jgi:2-polyprenyl-3-methyl-5-hydroxy-6-metoxy-1,4-benzoquinol methylase
VSTRDDARARARELCTQYAAEGKDSEWFEAFYREARQGRTTVPWADLVPNTHLFEWHRQTGYDFHGKRCLTVGCGLGDDAEWLADNGGRVTAFDIAPTAVAWCRERFPASGVEYAVADLLEPPPEWEQQFDFVFEANTLQVLPADRRPQAMRQLAGFVAPAGMLLVICRGREPSEPPGPLPWPLTREELIIGVSPLDLVTVEERYDADPPVRRFRASFHR